jgi:hypothetical protein
MGRISVGLDGHSGAVGQMQLIQNATTRQARETTARTLLFHRGR